MKTLKSLLTAVTLFGVIMLGTFSAKADNGSGNPPCVPPDGGVIIAGIAGVIIAGITGIIITGYNDDGSVCGIIITQ